MNEIEKITSRDNQRLVYARKVRDGREDGRIFVEGKRLVAEALRSGVEIDECYFTSGFDDEDLLYTVADRAKGTFELSAKLFNSIADTKNPQGIILIAKRPANGRETIEQRLRAGEGTVPLVLFLKEINNPANLGAIMRTAEAAGVAGVVVSTGSADVHSPKATRAAMGASFRVPVWDGVTFDEGVEWAKGLGLKTIAADISADKSYADTDWTSGAMLIFGSEAHGLSVAELLSVDNKILIPMANGVESLNLAVSAGIIMFEAVRQLTTDN
ncbi:MAG: RNA methyltransferase [Pyrinomonadaceae bacterium]|nr:RNA methyltransferase [Chloracidobacterium sp.]